MNEHASVFDLTRLPPGAALRSVTAEPANIAGRRALRVELSDDAAVSGRPGVDYVDMPTFTVVPLDFQDGTIEVDILSRLNQSAPDYARAFAGIAYRVIDGESFEAVYVRPLNGLKTNPPSPRDRRAIQYFAYPDWRFERLRERYPDGRYEAGADIGPDEWIRLSIDVDGTGVKVSINGAPALTVDKTKAAPVAGQIGLFVDIGTEAFFSNLTVTPR